MFGENHRIDRSVGSLPVRTYFYRCSTCDTTHKSQSQSISNHARVWERRDRRRASSARTSTPFSKPEWIPGVSFSPCPTISICIESPLNLEYGREVSLAVSVSLCSLPKSSASVACVVDHSSCFHVSITINPITTKRRRGFVPALAVLVVLTITIITLLVRHIRLEDSVDGDW